MRTRFSVRRYAAPAACISALVALVTLIVVCFPTSSDARSLALHKAGFTSVTSVSRKYFSLCHEDYLAFTVRGIRNGQRATVTACISEAPWMSYIR